MCKQGMVLQGGGVLWKGVQISTMCSFLTLTLKVTPTTMVEEIQEPVHREQRVKIHKARSRAKTHVDRSWSRSQGG